MAPLNGHDSPSLPISGASTPQSSGMDGLAAAASFVAASAAQQQHRNQQQQPAHRAPHAAVPPPPPAAALPAVSTSSTASSARASFSGISGQPHANVPAEPEEEDDAMGDDSTAGGAGEDAQQQNSGSGSTKKGSRISKACLPCSQRKRKCDGGKPECSVCQVLGLTCSYSSNAIKRGPPKGFRAGPREGVKVKLLRTLETTLRDLVGKIGSAETQEEVRKLGQMKGLSLADFSVAGPSREGMAAEQSDEEDVKGKKRKRAGVVRTQEDEAYAKDLLSLKESGGRPRPPQTELMPIDPEISGDFLGVNERGDLMHRGSSSGIQLLHSRTARSPLTPGSGPHVASSSSPLAKDGREIASSPGTEAQPAAGASGSGAGTPSGNATTPGSTGQGASTSPAERRASPPPSGPGVRSSSRGRHAAFAYGPLINMPGAPVPLPMAHTSRVSAFNHHYNAASHGSQHHFPNAPSSSSSAGGRYDASASGGRDQQQTPMARSFSRSTSRSRSRSVDRGRRRSEREVDPSAMAVDKEPQRGRSMSLRGVTGRYEGSPLVQALSGGNSGSGNTSTGEGDDEDDKDRIRTGQRSAAAIARSKMNSATVSVVRINDAIDEVDPDNDPIVGPEECKRLFTYYWKEFHPFWPILYKVSVSVGWNQPADADVLLALQPAVRDISVEDVAERLDPVLLYSIYAVASCIVPRERTKGDTPQQEQEDRGGVFFERAERYLYAGRLRPDVSTIQSLFLLSLYAHGSGELSQAWVWCNLASSMAIDLGLHRWPIHRYDLLWDSNERETRVRLIWHLFILDKMLAAEMGRPVGIRANDIDAPFLSEQEMDEFELFDDTALRGGGEGEAAVKKGRPMHLASCLNATARLFIIVEKILSEFHSFRRKAALRKQGAILDMVNQVDAELAQWHKDLPDHLRLDRSFRTIEGEPLPATFALAMWYHTSILLLHRNFIPQDQGVPLSDVLANDSYKKSTAAANSIGDMLERTSQFVRVDRLSTDLGYCFFTAAVFYVFNARLPDEKIANDAKRRFMLCRESLRKLSETWPAASAHKQLLDGFSAVGEGVLSDETTATVLDLPPPKPVASDFVSPGADQSTPPGEGTTRGSPSKAKQQADAQKRGRSKTRRADRSAERSTSARKSASRSRGSKSRDKNKAAERRPSSSHSGLTQMYRPETWTAEQRAQMAELYTGSGASGDRPNASAHSFNPGLFDLESVFYNEWKTSTALPQAFTFGQPRVAPANSNFDLLGQQQQQQQPSPMGVMGPPPLPPHQHQPQQPVNQFSQEPFQFGSPGMSTSQPSPQQMQLYRQMANQLSASPQQLPPAMVALLMQAQQQHQQAQQHQPQQQTEQSSAEALLRQNAQANAAAAAAANFGLNMQGLPFAPGQASTPTSTANGNGQQPQTANGAANAFGISAASPFSFPTDQGPNPNAILELMAMLELPPSFA